MNATSKVAYSSGLNKSNNHSFVGAAKIPLENYRPLTRPAPAGLERFSFQPSRVATAYERFAEERNSRIVKRKDLKFRALSIIAHKRTIINKEPNEYKDRHIIIPSKPQVHMRERQKSIQGDKENLKNDLSLFQKGCVYDYMIGKQIGQGAYATVKEAVHLASNKSVAIKIYDKIKFEEPRRKERVVQEISILKKLDHENLVKFYDTFDSPKHLYLVMELIHGKSLHQYLKMRPLKKLPESEAIKLFKQILSGVHCCHVRNVSHRDLKLENILLDETGKIRIIDFGFSVQTKGKLKTHSGTPSYMAPEVVSRKDYYGQPADIWALGVLLYVMLCGCYPFKGSTERELFERIKLGSYAFPEGISDSAKALIKRLLDMDPYKRPTCEEIWKDPLLLSYQKI